MNKNRASALLVAGLSLAFALVGSGCKTNGSAGPSGGASPGSLTSGSLSVGVVNNLGFYAQAVFANPSVISYLHTQNTSPPSLCSPTQKAPTFGNCNVAPGTQAIPFFASTGANNYAYNVNDLYCILDVAELDLAFTDFQMNMNAPASFCDYAESMPYGYYNYQPGVVTGSYTATINASSTPSFLAGYVCTSNCRLQGVGPSSLPDGLRIDGGNDGGVLCDYDYGPIGGPNCCSGSVSQTITTIPQSGPLTSVTSTILFTGLSSACLTGPAAQVNPKDVLGNPVALVMYSGVNGTNYAYTVKSPMGQGLITGMNLFSSNFWDPAFWNPGPAGNPTIPATFPPQDSNNVFLPNGPCMTGAGLSLGGNIDPTCSTVHPAPAGAVTSQALPPPLDYTQLGQHYGGYSTTGYPMGLNPYYRFGCLDTAGEYNARIQVLVRSFDTLGNWSCNNNPYMNGQVDNGFDDPLHDFAVWEDFNYTGNHNLSNPVPPPVLPATAVGGTPFSPYYPDSP